MTGGFSFEESEVVLQDIFALASETFLDSSLDLASDRQEIICVDTCRTRFWNYVLKCGFFSSRFLTTSSGHISYITLAYATAELDDKPAKTVKVSICFDKRRCFSVVHGYLNKGIFQALSGVTCRYLHLLDIQWFSIGNWRPSNLVVNK